jgi:hypothetical protein
MRNASSDIMALPRVREDPRRGEQGLAKRGSQRRESR